MGWFESLYWAIWVFRSGELSPLRLVSHLIGWFETSVLVIGVIGSVNLSHRIGFFLVIESGYLSYRIVGLYHQIRKFWVIWSGDLSQRITKCPKTHLTTSTHEPVIFGSPMNMSMVLEDSWLCLDSIIIASWSRMDRWMNSLTDHMEEIDCLFLCPTSQHLQVDLHHHMLVFCPCPSEHD